MTTEQGRKKKNREDICRGPSRPIDEGKGGGEHLLQLIRKKERRWAWRGKEKRTAINNAKSLSRRGRDLHSRGRRRGKLDSKLR